MATVREEFASIRVCCGAHGVLESLIQSLRRDGWRPMSVYADGLYVVQVMARTVSRSAEIEHKS